MEEWNFTVYWTSDSIFFLISTWRLFLTLWDCLKVFTWLLTSPKPATEFSLSLNYHKPLLKVHVVMITWENLLFDELVVLWLGTLIIFYKVSSAWKRCTIIFRVSAHVLRIIQGVHTHFNLIIRYGCKLNSKELPNYVMFTLSWSFPPD